MLTAEQIVASNIIPTLAAQLPGDEFTIGVHQIRIIANDDDMGKPAPEGIHRDGFDFVAVIVDAIGTHGLGRAFVRCGQGASAATRSTE